MHLANALLVFPALAAAAETFVQPFQSWDCVNQARGPIGTGEFGHCINIGTQALSLAMEKKTNIAAIFCTIYGEENCTGDRREFITLNKVGAAHVCKNPSLNGFKSISCAT